MKSTKLGVQYSTYSFNSFSFMFYFTQGINASRTFSSFKMLTLLFFTSDAGKFH